VHQIAAECVRARTGSTCAIGHAEKDDEKEPERDRERDDDGDGGIAGRLMRRAESCRRRTGGWIATRMK
jgi:hypothetical protein